MAAVWLGLAVGVINFLAVFDTVRQNAFYQGVLGWSSWLMPMSWLVNGLGLVFFVLNILGALFTLNQVNALKITYIHMDWGTGSIVMKGGWISNLNSYHTAFDMGNFVYVDRLNSSPDDDVPHETGQDRQARRVCRRESRRAEIVRLHVPESEAGGVPLAVRLLRGPVHVEHLIGDVVVLVGFDNHFVDVDHHGQAVEGGGLT